MRHLLTLPLAALVATPSVAQNAPADVLQKLDTVLAQYAPTIGGYPPNVKNGQELATVGKNWKVSSATVQRLVRLHPKDAQVLWRAGEFYRMGHNLDADKAWEKSETYCKAAIALDPKCAPAHLTLGTLYVNTDPSRAPAAEKAFQTVVDLGDPKTLPGARRGLVSAYYFQGRFREASEAADAYLKLRPDDAGMKELKGIIDGLVKKSER